MEKVFITHHKKFGGSLCIVIPRDAKSHFPFLEGELLEMRITKNSVFIRRGDW